MYAHLYGLPRRGLPFADLRGNSRETIIRNFHCQFVHLLVPIWREPLAA